MRGVGCRARCELGAECSGKEGEWPGSHFCKQWPPDITSGSSHEEPGGCQPHFLIAPKVCGECENKSKVRSEKEFSDSTQV